ncbi:hypothetical protein FA15DRAFT_552016, partial [Coprinopsis marcescibilis]
LWEIDVQVGGRMIMIATLDDGSELVIITRKKCLELGLPVNMRWVLMMEAANGSQEVMVGCMEWLEIKIGGMKTWAHAYIVETAPYDLLLGRPWQRSVGLQKVETKQGVDVVVHNP